MYKKKNGDLKDKLFNCVRYKTRIPDKTILKWSEELLQATHYINSKKMFHSDIKPE